MKTWKDSLTSPETDLRTALNIIDRAGSQIALVVDDCGRLVGTLSDGDIRRALLSGVVLSDPVSLAMHRSPTAAYTSDDRYSILATMRRLGLHQMPVIDSDGRVTGLQLLGDYLATPVRRNWVVIMAGGLGSRLKELTTETPKPMLKVGNRPILETIVKAFANQGFRHFKLAVNYKAEQIEQHFARGDSFGVEINYLRERNRLGTAGALSLLEHRPNEPIVVTNADLLTKEDYGSMVDDHLASGSDATMGVREYEFQVPFGVVHTNEMGIESIEEKPVHRVLVNAGVYVLSPSVLDLVPSDSFYDMPTLFEAVIASGMKTRTHMIRGYWLDIGRMPDYERANIDFGEVFL